MTYICVSGLQGAGKTTLARALASRIGWAYLPEAQPAILFLTDLFQNPSRWAFETQTAFLVSKATQLKAALERGLGVVLDRTLYEDADIFAEYFNRRGAIDPRSYATFRALADHFFTELPKPSLVIVCECSVAVARTRLSNRPDSVAGMYPPGHLEDILELYHEWEAQYEYSDMVGVDTERYDFRLKKNIEQVSKVVLAHLTRHRDTTPQLALFEVPEEPVPERDAMLHPLHLLAEPHDRAALPARTAVRVTPFPSAYIAAPFTTYADGAPGNDGWPPLFESAQTHGVLRRGWYRDFLLRIERTLRRLGVHSIIPHRDINAWGERTLTPAQVTELCSQYVAETDVFVGLLGTSSGAHYEFGLALGLGKPAVVIKLPEVPDSFIAEGVGLNLVNTLVVTLKTEAELEGALLSPEVRRFLSRFIPIEGATL